MIIDAQMIMFTKLIIIDVNIKSKWYMRIAIARYDKELYTIAIPMIGSISLFEIKRSFQKTGSMPTILSFAHKRKSLMLLQLFTQMMTC
jgi:hypothetical protein